jgi:hypothetical protein
MMNEKQIRAVMDAIVKAKKQSVDTGLFVGEFRCAACEARGVVRWQVLNPKKNTTRGACTTANCVMWIE